MGTLSVLLAHRLPVLASQHKRRYSRRVVENNELSPPSGLVAGKYKLTRLLGRGGMGAVWEGTHQSLGTHVAVKFIDAEYAESPEARSRFENEARAAARLRSKHVVEVYDHGVSEDGRPFIVMEYLEGEPLDKRLDRLGRLTAKETAQIVLQVCRALMKAHTANIVHRDLKPENVFLVWDDEERTDIVKVVDFGIAKFTDASMGSSASTRTGSVLGTPYYMSPEQARGLRNVDYRSDLWSVAVIAYRCIVGSLPFEGEAVGDLLVKLCTAPIPVPSQLVQDVPPGFDAWLAKALSREPAERFSSAAQLGESLAAVCGVPVRGAYVSSEMARMSELGSGPYGAVSAASAPAFGPGLAANVAPIALATGAPTSRTPAPMKRKPTGAIVAATAAAFVVFAIGGAVVLKKLSAPSGGPATAAPPGPVATLASLPAVAAPAATASATTVAAANSAQSTVETATAAVAKNPPKAAARAPAKPPAPAKPSPKPASARKDSDIGF